MNPNGTAARTVIAIKAKAIRSGKAADRKRGRVTIGGLDYGAMVVLVNCD
jgi:hypothetical protein